MTYYRQAGRFGLFPICIPLLGCNTSLKDFIGDTYHDIFSHFKDGNLDQYFNEEQMYKIAEIFLDKNKGNFPEGWEEQQKEIQEKLLHEAKKIKHLELETTSNEQLYKHFNSLKEITMKMWGIMVFIDSFDPGMDQEQITTISKKHGFSEEEAGTLSLPLKQAFITKWHNKLELVKEQKLDPTELEEEFFWIGTNANEFSEMTVEKILELSKTVHSEPFHSPYEKQEAILTKYSLQKNPLNTYQLLSEWRDIRKMLMLASTYGFLRLIREGLRKRGIDQKLAFFLLHDEIEDVFLREPPQAAMKERQGHVLLHCQPDGTFKEYRGDAAIAKWKEIHNEWLAQKSDEITGMTACKGQVEGIVRIIRDPKGEKAVAFKEGEILVSAMTRPDFLPLMKKAGAIITDEGGISCHAAIVAREMKKPCIIGAHVATALLKDGEHVIVDADNGVVRRLHDV